MSLTETMVNGVIRGLTGTVCKINNSQLARVPSDGPMIIAINHVNFLEAPILYTQLQPRPVTGFSKVESWDKWWMAKLFNLWGIIPIRRFSADSQAIRPGLEVLKDGHFLAVAPEGTRSGTGVMQQAYPGVVLMALHSGAPVLPIGLHGAENFWNNLKRLRRTPFNIEVGRPFYVRPNGTPVDKQVRACMLDEIMYQVALLLPERYRGVYADISRATDTYLEFV